MKLSCMWSYLTHCHESGCLSPHYNCTSPMDYNSHHSLHYNTHISIHHCTNHTAVTSHSLALIVLPHLHLIHSPTYKQHISLHTMQSLVLAPADISERLPFPLISTSVFDPGLPDLGTLNLCLWPQSPPGIVYVSALPLIFLVLPADRGFCLCLNKYYCTWIHMPLTSLYTHTCLNTTLSLSRLMENTYEDYCSRAVTKYKWYIGVQRSRVEPRTS